MNIKNIKAAIEIMKRASGQVNMCSWQRVGNSENISTTEEELHRCGNSACFGGWVAVSPEFQADGGEVCEDSAAPIYGGVEHANAIARWLDISKDEARQLVFGNLNSILYSNDFSPFYNKPWNEVVAEDVIEKLEQLLEKAEKEAATQPNSREIISDAELEDIFQGTNFGTRDHRKLLDASVLKKALGYHCGHTITQIMIELGLINEKGNLLRRGQRLLHVVYGHLITQGG